VERYASDKGRRTIESRLRSMFRHTGASHPDQLSTRRLLAWVTEPGLANNTVRARLAVAQCFCRWCVAMGYTEYDPCAQFPNLNRQYPTTYGKVQSKNPARRLSHAEAYGQLVRACQDGTDAGLRDECIIRLGLSGMRRGEIASLTIASVDHLPSIQWIGKGNKPRHMTTGAALTTVLGEWVRVRLANGRSTGPEDALFVPRTHSGRMNWTLATTGTNTLNQTIERTVIRRARQAGLGHVTPHDLRRSAADILHNTIAEDGGHVFDLLDIQKILGHSDPATTMRCYIDPADTAVLDRAAKYLD